MPGNLINLHILPWPQSCPRAPAKLWPHSCGFRLTFLCTTQLRLPLQGRLRAKETTCPWKRWDPPFLQKGPSFFPFSHCPRSKPACTFETRIDEKVSTGPSGLDPFLSELWELGHFTDPLRMKYEERKGSLIHAEKQIWGWEKLREEPY